MAFIRQNSARSAVVSKIVGPVVPRRRRVGAPLGAIRPDSDLTRYPNGAKLSTLGSFVTVPSGVPTRSRTGVPTLSGYESAPDLTQYTNGRPLPTVGGANTPKAALVVMAFNHAMSKRNGGGNAGASLPMMSKHRRRGMCGLGDDASDVQAISDAANQIQDSVDASADTEIDTSGSTTSVPYTGPLIVAGDTPMSTIPGVPTYQAPGASTIGSAFSNLLSSLLRPAGTTVPAYYSVGSGLAAPIVAGSSVSTGGALLLAGGALLLILVLKKR